MTKSTIERLQDWYLSQCNEDWEHSFGIDIGTLDNPGFTLDVDLEETDLASRAFSPVHIQREDEHDWVHCKVEGNKFTGACGPRNLDELLNVFLNWADSSSA
ncbi:MAG: immunity 53 family protein [Holophagaceae bacterium]|nr:immunity 53 family protein [Holophagaceae bacterium]